MEEYVVHATKFDPDFREVALVTEGSLTEWRGRGMTEDGQSFEIFFDQDPAEIGSSTRAIYAYVCTSSAELRTNVASEILQAAQEWANDPDLHVESLAKSLTISDLIIYNDEEIQAFLSEELGIFMDHYLIAHIGQDLAVLSVDIGG